MADSKPEVRGTGYNNVRRAAVDATEWTTGDDTIALVDLEADDDDEELFDINRLRRALVAYDEEFGGDTVSLSIREIEFSNGFSTTVLTLSNDGASRRAIALAHRVPAERGEE